MNTLTFDTHAFVKRLTAVGITEEQAEVFAAEQSHLVNETLATKLDIELVRRDVKELEVALKGDIELLRLDIRESEVRMVKWLIPLLLGQAALIAAMVKLL